LTHDIAGNLQKAEIKTKYVTPAYLKGILTQDRIEQVKKAGSSLSQINLDYKPYVYYSALKRWLQENPTSLTFTAVVLCICLFLYLLQLKPVSTAVFCSGLSAGAMEFLILLSFQVVAGTLYHSLGIIITAFMVGLAFGSFIFSYKIKVISMNHLLILESGILAVLAGFAGMIILSNHLSFLESIPTLVFSSFAFMLSFFVGAEFPVAAHHTTGDLRHVAGSLYSADLLGSFLGIVAVGCFLYPRFGILYALWILLAIKVFSLALLAVTARKRT